MFSAPLHTLVPVRETYGALEDMNQKDPVQPVPPPIGSKTPSTVTHDEDSDLVRKAYWLSRLSLTGPGLGRFAASRTTRIEAESYSITWYR